jgi:antitoxin (DNA-binding transcriptional repressor) of toxin-antitoxin stability system
MSVKTVERHEFERSVGSFLDFVSKGNEVVVVQDNTVQARLTAPAPPPTQTPRQPDRYAGKVWMAEDFDAPLPDSFWLGDEE